MDESGVLAIFAILKNPAVYVLLALSLAILYWLYRDMKRQREWREAKEDKIARTKARIARRNAQKDAD